MTLRILNYGNYGIFLIMGNAGFCPSAVSLGFPLNLYWYFGGLLLWLLLLLRCGSCSCSWRLKAPDSTKVLQSGDDSRDIFQKACSLVGGVQYMGEGISYRIMYLKTLLILFRSPNYLPDALGDGGLHSSRPGDESLGQVQRVRSLSLPRSDGSSWG